MDDRTLLALYLLLYASRRGSNTITLSNSCLKRLLPRKRVHATPLRRFARTFEPIFINHTIGTEKNGVKTTLTLYSADELANRGKAIGIYKVPSIETIKGELGLP